MGNGNCTRGVSCNAFEPRPIEITELYKACEAGNVEEVKKLLSSTPVQLVNCLEPNGNTALHIASSRGHIEIVRLLVQEYGVICHRKNVDGLTAFQVAANKEARKIFRRPLNSDRYCTVEAISKNIFAMIFPASKRKPSLWIHSTSGWYNIKRLEGNMKKQKIVHNNRALDIAIQLNHDIPNLFPIKQQVKWLRGLVDSCVTPSSSEYKRACQCLDEYKQTEKVEPLLRLYSLETPFYSKVGTPIHCNLLLEPLKRNLNVLTERHFQGISYRGLSMTKEDLEDYEEAFRQAEKKGDSVITLASFASTTHDKEMAQFYAEARTTEGKIMVLMTCLFPNRCDTAIALYAVSESLPCITNYEDEQEVLLYPGTMFRVTRIDTTTDANFTHIHLTNVVPEIHVGVEVLHVVKNKALNILLPSFLR